MPLELLKQLINSEMPVTLHDPRDIDRLRVLRAAGMVLAAIPDEGDALVFQTTEKGRMAAEDGVDIVED